MSHNSSEVTLGVKEDIAHKDPVCGMTVAADKPHHLEHAGHEYRFCSSHCMGKFQANPDAYIKAEVNQAATPTRLAAGIHLPDASESGAQRTRRLPDLRHGFRAAQRSDGRQR